MAIALPDGTISTKANELVTIYGFVGAKEKARYMVMEWAEDTGADADYGMLVWERVWATISIMQARLM